MNINDLNDQWITLGQKLTDLQNKAVLMVSDEASTVEDMNAIKNDIKTLEVKRDLAKANLDDARANQVIEDAVKPVKPLTNAENDMKGKFVNEFIGMMKNQPEIVNQINSSTDAAGNAIGLTIPQDIQTAIHTLVRQYQSLEQYVKVESVSTLSGSRVYEKWTDVTPLAALDAEDALIGNNDDPKLSVIKYLIKRYAGITTVTNSLLSDSAENILAWLSAWIAKKVVVTRNAAIISVMQAAPKKATIAKFDDIKDLALTGVDPAIETTSFFMTNQSGFAVLSKVKDAMGQYLIQPNVTNPSIKQIEGKNVVVIADRWLPNAANNVHPFYFGDLSQAVTLFDREQMSLLSTNIGAGSFETDTTKVRVIDRFDVQATDTEAWVAGSFTTIADQVANIAPAVTDPKA